MPFSPSSVSGITFWYKADQFSLSSGSYIYGWSDLSGSGNNLTPSVSSTTNAPVYIPNVINGYPVVRFSGTNFLQTASNANSVLCLGDNFTSFCVYSTTGVTEQVLFGNAGSTATTIDYIVSISGGFAFNYGIGDYAAGTGSDLRSFVLRHDRFRQSDGEFFFGYFGKDVASGNFSLAPSINNTQLMVGYSQGYGVGHKYYFQGDIAEIVGYDRALSESDVASVNNYLLGKYFPSSSSTTPTGPISSITGCFLWFQGDSVGTTNGNIVTYWHDDSGSGNSVSQASTSGVGTPIYITGVPLFNNHNVVRFSGVTNYLVNSSNNASLNFSPSSVTFFTVYSTPVMNTQQTLFAIDNVTDRNSACSISINEINQNVLSPSGFGFGWGKGGALSNNGWFSISPSSASQGFQVAQPNVLTIRYDRFRPQDGIFAFGLNNVVVGTGIANTQVSTNNLFRIGNDVSYNNYFRGDIAEIIGYNQKLTDSQVTAVNNYLIAKYTPTSTPTPPPTINYTIPSDLSGLFAWYRSTSIGITGVDGSRVQYWPDDSGSGNNLSIILSSSSTWVFPQFYRSQVNGYPTVRFINGGGYSYLTSTFGVASLKYSQNDLTTFCVFKTVDGTTPQSIFTQDDGLHSSIFDIGLNSQTNNSFCFGNGYYTSYSELTASSTIFGTNTCPTNQFMIRSDRFRPQDGYLYFGRYGAEFASGNTSTYSLPNSVLTVGYNVQGNAFYGDIAEIIAYRRKLSDIEVEEINEYLLQKYMPGNVGLTTLFVYGTTNSGSFKSSSLYTTSANSSTSKAMTLYAGNIVVQNSSKTLYTTAAQTTNKNCILFMDGSLQHWPPITLYTVSNPNPTGQTTLYIGSTIFSSNHTTLYTSGSIASNNNNIKLYIGASSVIAKNTTLFTEAGFTTTSGINLYTPGSLQQWPPITLYLPGSPTGDSLPHGTIALYTKAVATPKSTLTSPLYTYASSPGTTQFYNHTPLYLEGGKLYQSMPLYVATLPAPPVNTNPSSYMPLFIGDAHATGYYNGSLSLYVANSVSAITGPIKRLYTKGAGGLQGGYVINSDVLPLYLFNNGINPPPTSSTPQASQAYYYNYYSDPSYFQTDYFDVISFSGTTRSVINSSNGMTLFIGANATANSGISLYQHGVTSNSGGIISMYTTGRNLALTNSDTLYIRGF